MGVPCAATEITRAKNTPVKITDEMTKALKAKDKINQEMKEFRKRISGRSMTPKENELEKVLIQQSNIVDEQRDKAYQNYLAARMKEVCDILYNTFGKATNEEEENMCREGQSLIERAMRSNEKRRNNILMSWIDKTDELMGRCRWIECRPERSTSALTKARRQLADWKQAWKEFETKVRKMNGMCRKLTWCQTCELERLTKWGIAVNASIKDNCDQIIFEQENETDSRNDIT